MKRDLPGWTLLAGILLEWATVEFKKQFAASLGQSSPLMWTMSAIACGLFGLGLAIALRNLFRDTHQRHAFVYLCLNLFAIVGLYVIHITDYILFSKLEQIPTASSVVKVLPTLIEKAQEASTEPRRKLMAQRAYQYCGARLFYRRDDGNEVQYAPDIADEKTWKNWQQNDRLSQDTRGIAYGQLRQLPSIMILNAGSFLLAFTTTTWWLAFGRHRPPEPA